MGKAFDQFDPGITGLEDTSEDPTVLLDDKVDDDLDDDLDDDDEVDDEDADDDK